GHASHAAKIRLLGTDGNQNRTAGLMLRPSLEPDSAYADVVLHGDGLTSLQYRETKGGSTHEIQSNVARPRRIRIEKEGDYVFMSSALGDEALRAAGGSMRIKLNEPFYVGLGVCAHDNNALEKALFSNVEIISGRATADGQPVLESTLETVAIASKDRRVIYHAREHFEAPNWSRDGKYFLFNRGGRIYKLAATGGEPQLLDTRFARRCNNDH